MEPLFYKEENGNTITIIIDEYTPSPREAVENLFKICGYNDDYYDCFDEHVSRETVENVVINTDGDIDEEFKGDNVCFPVMFSRKDSKVIFSINKNTEDDANKIYGYMFVEKAKIYSKYSVNKISKELYTELKTIAENELKFITQWENGDVYELEVIYNGRSICLPGMYDFEEAKRYGMRVLEIGSIY